MNVKFWPSLQIIAYARVAQGILYTFDLEILKNNFIKLKLVNENYINQIKKMISVILVPFRATFSHLSTARAKFENIKNIDLPNKIQNKLAGVVMALGLEITNWLEWHKTFLKRGNLNLRNRLVWFSFGFIDRFKTAQMYIQDENFSILNRFLLACKYYFEDDVQMLWERMPTDKRVYSLREFSKIRSMEFWLEVVNTNNSLDWERISLRERNSYFIGNCLGIRYYFTKLRCAESRYQSIFHGFKRGTIHHFDLYLCLSVISDRELNGILTRLPTSILYNVFESFLNWPFQHMFLDVVTSLERHINGKVFFHLISYIMLNKRNAGCQDYDYVELFKCFWKLMSPMYGSYVKDDELISEYVKDILKHS